MEQGAQPVCLSSFYERESLACVQLQQEGGREAYHRGKTEDRCQ